VDAADWDERYSGRELVWGAEPNRFVAAELEGQAPGRVLDVACGEGRNALWLAARGWQATGVDFSAAAVARGRRLAAQAGAALDLQVGDVVRDPLPAGPFDAVVVAYLQLPAEQRATVLRKAFAVTAPGGLLIVVAHDSSNLEHGHGGPQDPTVLYSPEDVVGDLAGAAGVVVERAEVVQRPVQVESGERIALDALVRARRRE
jgi:SAM-dependent methyltransferase